MPTRFPSSSVSKFHLSVWSVFEVEFEVKYLIFSVQLTAIVVLSIKHHKTSQKISNCIPVIHGKLRRRISLFDGFACQPAKVASSEQLTNRMIISDSAYSDTSSSKWVRNKRSARRRLRQARRCTNRFLQLCLAVDKDT